MTPAAVSQFESGVTRPGADTLTDDRRAGRPGWVLLAAGDGDTRGFFRSLRRTSVTHRRHARALAHIAHDLAVDRAGQLRSTRASTSDTRQRPASPPGGTGRASRRRAKRSACRAARCRTSCGILEDHGILVIRLPLDTADVDAFSLPFHDRPIVVLGADKNDRATIPVRRRS